GSQDRNEISILTMIAPLKNRSSTQSQIITAAELAVKEANAKFAKEGSPLHITLVIGDLDDNPDIALKNLKVEYDKGARLVLCPMFSAHLIAFRSFIDRNNMVCISPGSTAPVLAIADSVYRVIIDDTKQTQMLAQKIIDDGFTNLAIMYRDDLYGIQFYEYLSKDYSALGGSIEARQYYPVNSVTYVQQIQNLRDQLVNSGVDSNETALVIVASDEILEIIQAMIKLDESYYSSFRWYGTDSSALQNGITNNKKVAAFLVAANFIAVTPDVQDRNSKVLAELWPRLGATDKHLFGIYSVLAYDTISLFAAVAASLPPESRNDMNQFRLQLPIVANKLCGYSGNLALNEFGDRLFMPISVLNIKPVGTEYLWNRETNLVPVGQNAAGQIIINTCF
ncbi:MAG: ABC transporter substrate-binding protein, partial [bacterium]|nr:ABC transporter substrate-binding protein [bacterium]